MYRPHVSNYFHWIPAVILLLLLSQAVTQCNAISASNRVLEVEHYPQMSADQAWARFDELDKLTQRRQEGTPDDYYKTLNDIEYLSAAMNRLDAHQGLNAVSSDNRSVRFMIFGLNRLRNQLFEHIGGHGVRELSEARRDALIKRYKRPEFVRASGGKSTAWPFILLALNISLFAAPIFFVIRLKQEGLRVWSELPYIMKWSILWPIGVFKYPNHSIADQVVRFRRWLAGAVAMLLGLSPMTGAYAKAGSKTNGGAEVVEVGPAGPTITTVDPPTPQLLPTLVINGVSFNLRGWVNIQDDLTSPGAAKITMAKTRVIIDTNAFELFTQLDVNGSPTIDALRLSYDLAPGYEVSIGRLFTQAADSVPAPFTLETVSGPPLPVEFFMSGVAIDGTEGNVSFGADVAFDGSAGSANVKVSFDQDSFLRLTAQQMDDFRAVIDGETAFGSNTVRAAAYYRSQGSRIGGYLLLLRDVGDDFTVFTQLEFDGSHPHFFSGATLHVNDNVDLTAEAGDRAVRARLRARF